MFSLLCIKVKKWDWEGGEISYIYILNKECLFCTNVWKSVMCLTTLTLLTFGTMYFPPKVPDEALMSLVEKQPPSYNNLSLTNSEKSTRFYGEA